METGKNEKRLSDETGVAAIPKTKIIDREALPNSPFSLVTIEEGSFIAMGRYRITHIKDRSECLADYEDKPWDLILSAVSVLQEILENRSNNADI